MTANKNMVNLVPDSSILFVEHGRYKRKWQTSLHKHHFWQIEFITRGHAYVEINEQKHSMSSKTFVVIPPEEEHIFFFPGILKETWSIKFIVENFNTDLSPLLITSDSISDSIKGIILKFISEDILHKPKEKALIESMLNAIIMQYFFNNETGQSIDSRIEKTKELIAVNKGKPLSISELSKDVCCSPAHLSRIFKKELGIPLKSYIDLKRYEYAKEMLLYSDKNITEISHQLEFPDQFCFSRFFKKFNGQSPQLFLKADLISKCPLGQEKK